MGDIVVSHLVLSFGRSAIPIIYQILTDSGKTHHISVCLTMSGRSGRYPFKKIAFVGDSMFIGVDLAGRLKQNND